MVLTKLTVNISLNRCHRFLFFKPKRTTAAEAHFTSVKVAILKCKLLSLVVTEVGNIELSQTKCFATQQPLKQLYVFWKYFYTITKCKLWITMYIMCLNDLHQCMVLWMSGSRYKVLKRCTVQKQNLQVKWSRTLSAMHYQAINADEECNSDKLIRVLIKLIF